jgi:ABC-type polysaccharide/polyol phosphate export permease
MVKLRDLKHIFELFFNLLFWATPIVYTTNDIKNRSAILGKIVELNPLGIFIETSRQALIFGKIENINKFVIVTIVAISMYLLGLMYFKKKVRKVAEFI